MPKPQYTKAKAFKPSETTYKPPTVNKRGGKNVQVLLNGQPLILQIPLMLTWGVNERVDEQSGRVSYDLSLQFEKGKSQAVEKFRTAFEKFQSKILDDAVANSKAWFGKTTQSRPVLEALMYPILKFPKKKDDSGDTDYDRDPTVKLKIPYWEGKFNIELYDVQGKEMYIPPKTVDSVVPQGNKTPLDLVEKGAHLSGLIMCTGLWMAGGRFGVTWKLLQACVAPPVRLLGSRTCHIAYDSDDEQALARLDQKSTVEAQDVQEVEEVVAGPTFSDSEDEAEVEEEEEDKPATPPPAPKKKKVVRRRKKTAAKE